MAADAAYFAKYYAEHREKMLEKKKARYRDDPDYRARIQENSRARKRALAEEKKKLGINKKKKEKPIWFRVQVGDEEVPVRMYTAGQLARRLGRKTQTVRVWEKRGIIPEAIYRSTSKDRLYTELQVKLIINAYDLAEEMYGTNAVSNRIGSTNFSENVWKVWKDYPLGIKI